MTAIIIQKSFNLQYNRIINEAEDNKHDENSKRLRIWLSQSNN